MAFLRETLGDVITVHHGHMPEIELTVADDGHRHLGAAGHRRSGRTGCGCDGYGHYHETYEKVDGEWRIASSKLTRLHMDFTEPEEG